MHLEQVRWPRPLYNPGDEPYFIFILTPPYSGSTAMAKYLATSLNVGLLRKNGEGQILVPGIYRNWESHGTLDLESIRATWLNQYQEINKQGEVKIEVVVEKSPPNMVRIEPILTAFEKASCIVSNRDPVAFCSSSYIRNYHDRATLSLEERQTVLNKIALSWVQRSAILINLLRNHDYPRISYEKFCEEPHSLKDVVEKASGKTILACSNTYLRIKDYPPSQISNRNEEQISRLTEFEINTILKTLEAHTEVVKFFGYCPKVWKKAC